MSEQEKQFTMSMYLTKEDLYKDKAEYYQKKFEAAENTLKQILHLLDELSKKMKEA